MGLLPVEEIVVAVQVLFVAKLALKQGLRVRTTVRSLDVFLKSNMQIIVRVMIANDLKYDAPSERIA